MVSATVSHRNLLFGPEKSRVSPPSKSSLGSGATVSAPDWSGAGVSLGRLFGRESRGRRLERPHSSEEPLRLESVPPWSRFVGPLSQPRTGIIGLFLSSSNSLRSFYPSSSIPILALIYLQFLCPVVKGRFCDLRDRSLHNSSYSRMIRDHGYSVSARFRPACPIFLRNSGFRMRVWIA